MISQKQKDLIYDSCAAVYEDKEDASIIAEATVIRLENRTMSFREFVGSKTNGIAAKDAKSAS